jgi:ubiquinone/menaquinone biosynthesis C-methylase UbiE
MNSTAAFYLETSEKLRVRIRANREYTRSKLEDCLLRYLELANGRAVLEIGCGDGNFFSLYASALGPEGRLVGLDMNGALLGEAAAKAQQVGITAELMEWDFDDHPYPLADTQFDYVIAPFSAYYSKDIPAWIDDCLRVLRPRGLMLLIGPTSENAIELYALNQLVTGVRTIPETDHTSSLLQTDFLRELKSREGVRVTSTIIEREIVFPSPEEFARYYLATWLYEKTVEKVDRPITLDSVIDAAARTNLRLNKKLICIEARKREMR